LNNHLIGSRRKTPRPVGCNDHLIDSRRKTPRPVGYIDQQQLGIGSRRKTQGRSDTSITNNKQQFFIWLTNKFHRKTETGNFAGASPKTCRKMQNFVGASKLAGNKQNVPAVPKTEEEHWKQNRNSHWKLAGASPEYRRNLPEKTEQAGHFKSSNNRLKRWTQINVSTTQTSISRIFFFFPDGCCTTPTTLHQP
jgi:hypothetical protein